MESSSKKNEHISIIENILGIKNNIDSLKYNNPNKFVNIFDKPNSNLSSYQQKLLEQLENDVNILSKKVVGSNYHSKIMTNYINWINGFRKDFVSKVKNNELYYFFKFSPNNYSFNDMKDYWDIPDTPKLFSFCLFIGNIENLTYLVGLVYNYVIIRKHFPDYVMRIYIDFHSVFGSPETFNLLNMFLDILNDVDKTFVSNIQFIVFFLNPYFTVGNDTIYDSIVVDLPDVTQYYNDIFFNTSTTYIKSPLLNMQVKSHEELKKKDNANNKSKSNLNKKDILVDLDNLEVSYTNIPETTDKSTFAMLSCHIAVNLRFLPLNENCEFHVRDLDCRLSLTDIKIIEKFSSPKFQHVPYYVFQFYKFYFPYLKWRIDVNPYLAGCFGGSNRKSVMISKELEDSGNLKILKKEMFFKYILFVSFNSTNLHIGFLNDEFILANIFEKIKGKYSENILFLNLGSFANKHVNEYYYGLNDSSNYPCMLKLGIPIDILRYPLNGKYITIDPITDFKMGNIPYKYHNVFKNFITEQLLNYTRNNNVGGEKNKIANKIRINYKNRLGDEINDDLESALFFSMIPSNYQITGLDEFNDFNSYTFNSFNNDSFSSVGASSNIIKNQSNTNLKAINFLFAGYLLSDVLEDIIFPNKPEYINSNYFLSEDNFDRLFNCLYFDETKKKFLQKKININDVSRKYINQDIIDIIPKEFVEFDDKEAVKNKLNYEFNLYLKNSTYYPSMSLFIHKYKFYEFIQIDNYLIKTGILVFIKNYDKPIKDINNKTINNINKYDVKTLKYSINSDSKTIDSIGIKKNKLKFNLILFDDTSINQLVYHQNNNSRIDIKLVKSRHLEKLLDYMIDSNYANSKYLIVENL